MKIHGLLEGRDWRSHKFVTGMKDGFRKPFGPWEEANIPPEAVVFRVAQMRTREDAVLAGAGIGFLVQISGEGRSDMVQTFLKFVKAEFGRGQSE